MVLLVRLLAAFIIAANICWADNLTPKQEALTFEAVMVPNEVTVQLVGLNKPTSILIALKIINQGNAAVLIDKFATPQPELRSDHGLAHVATSRDLVNTPMANDFYVLEAHQITYIPVECVFYTDRKSSNFLGTGSRDGAGWKIGPLVCGTYHISLHYKAEHLQSYAIKRWNGVLSPWEGDVRSSTVDFTVH
jgi:hypothetical protein